MAEMEVVPSPLGGFDVLQFGIVVASFSERAAAMRYLEKCENGDRQQGYWWLTDDD